MFWFNLFATSVKLNCICFVISLQPFVPIFESVCFYSITSETQRRSSVLRYSFPILRTQGDHMGRGDHRGRGHHVWTMPPADGSDAWQWRHWWRRDRALQTPHGEERDCDTFQGCYIVIRHWLVCGWSRGSRAAAVKAVAFCCVYSLAQTPERLEDSLYGPTQAAPNKHDALAPLVTTQSIAFSSAAMSCCHCPTCYSIFFGPP